MAVDHGMEALAVRTMPVSKFKATCHAALERVRKTRRPLRLTRFGTPVADIFPPSPEARPSSWLGSMRGTLAIHGDIVGPVVKPGEWEALR